MIEEVGDVPAWVVPSAAATATHDRSLAAREVKRSIGLGADREEKRGQCRRPSPRYGIETEMLGLDCQLPKRNYSS
jgi:hypothetical protein